MWRLWFFERSVVALRELRAVVGCPGCFLNVSRVMDENVVLVASRLHALVQSFLAFVSFVFAHAQIEGVAKGVAVVVCCSSSYEFSRDSVVGLALQTFSFRFFMSFTFSFLSFAFVGASFPFSLWTTMSFGRWPDGVVA